MLHILNGDSLTTGFRQANIEGEFVVWRECLFEGPVHSCKSEADFWKMRARYILDTYGHDELDYRKNINESLSKIRNLGRYGEVVLWFEHDLFCQINLMYILKAFAEENYEISLSLVLPESYQKDKIYKGFGGLSGIQLRELFKNRKSISKKELNFAKELWYVYSLLKPSDFESLLNKTGDCSPFCKEALQAHLERFPSRENGLNSIEQIMLKAVEEGANEKIKIFERVWTEASIYGLGDLQILNYMKQLSNNKLLNLGEKIVITKLGKEVLNSIKNTRT